MFAKNSCQFDETGNVTSRDMCIHIAAKTRQAYYMQGEYRCAQCLRPKKIVEIELSALFSLKVTKLVSNIKCPL